ncbi:MAG: ATP-binding cassette domain-containing protein [Fibrobacter sp.]|nr:ATP-binding cassette domain-containing protein [Fibrobacter sp.]
MFHLITPDASKPFSIGRRESSDLRFNDLFVSRDHATLEKRGNDWFLKNLTSNSVTKVNDEDIDEKKLSDGDIIVIGVRRLRVTLNEGELSLLILDQNQDVDTYTLTSDYTTAGAMKARLVVEDGDKPNCAEILCGKKIYLNNGETVRVSESEVTFRDGNLLVAKIAAGFNVSIKNLDVYAGKKRLLQDINFELPAGEILAIIGRSGQGKSTLLKLLEGLYTKNENSDVIIGGLDYRKKEIRERIAFLAQDPALRKDLTVQETILHGARIAMDRTEFAATAAERFEKFTELFGLSERIHNRICTLSGGELRRTALAQELMGSPGLIVLDEPLSGLDPYNSKILCTHLKQLAFLGHTVILTTHSYEALRIANKVLVLHQGHQGYYGSPQGAYRYFKTTDPEAILSGLNDETATRWKESADTSDIGLGKVYSEVLFPKVCRKGSFFYSMGITLKQWFRDKGKIAALFLQPLVIGFLFSQIFSAQSSLWTVAFALILCANWFALSLSIREIVQEKEIFRNEFRKGQKITPVLLGKVLLPSIAAFLQTAVVYAFVAYRLDIKPDIAMLCAVFACTVLPAVSIGLLVSSLSKNAGQANAFLPLLIIPQVALAGALVPLDQMLPVGKALSTVIWSRYNHNSLLNLFLERPDDIYNKPSAAALALGFYIITAIILYRSKKAK